MRLRRKILVIAILVISLLISSLVLFFGENIINHDMILAILVIVETILVIFLSIDVLKNGRK